MAGETRDLTSIVSPRYRHRADVEELVTGQTVYQSDALSGCDYADRGGGVGGDSVRGSRNSAQLETV
jgi:hypothetical protein